MGRGINLVFHFDLPFGLNWIKNRTRLVSYFLIEGMVPTPLSFKCGYKENGGKPSLDREILYSFGD
jgi:hypothetical protein